MLLKFLVWKLPAPSDLSDQRFFEVELNSSLISNRLSRTKSCQKSPVERRTDSPAALLVQRCIISSVIGPFIQSVLVFLLVVVLFVLFPDGRGDVVVLGVDLALHLSVVEVTEVGHDDGHWQGDGEHAGNGAHGAHQLPPDRLWVHVPVADRCHWHHRPPEGLGDAGECRVRSVHLSKVNSAGKEDDADEEEEDEQGQLSEAGPQRLAQDLETLRVARELEDPEDPHQPDDPDEGQGDGRLSAFVLGQLRANCDKIGNDGEEVDGVHDVFEEMHLAGGAGEAYYELKREPADANSLHDEERVLEGSEARWDQDGFVGYGGMRDGGELLWNIKERKVVTVAKIKTRVILHDGLDCTICCL